jgi:hypothetical protein
VRWAVVLAIGLLGVAGSGSHASAALVPMRISADTLGSNVPGSHATQVEPSAVSSGSTIVSVFQVGRHFGGGASAIGFATSRDAGVRWISGLLPALTSWAPSPGPFARASDPVVTYDAAHRRFLAATLLINATAVSSSPDGTTWAPPLTVPAGGPADKEWIVCDSWAASPFRGHCYLAYTLFDPPGVNLRIAVQTSLDGGATWGGQVIIPIDNSVLRFEDIVSAQPLVRPNGELVVVYLEGQRAKAARSTDGGASFGAAETIAEVPFRSYSFAPEKLRGGNIPSVGVDAAGTLYVVWYDCRFHTGCGGNDIVLSQSPVVGRWTAPARIALPASSTSAEFLLPAITIDPMSSGDRTWIALAYYTLSSHDCAGAGCELRAGFAISLDGGRRWKAEAVGDAMALDWLAPTSIGRMVGDYVAAAFVPRRAVGIFSLASAPSGPRFDQAIAAVSVPLVEAPRNVRRPSVTGVPRVGRILTCRRGTWAGTPPIRFAYGWLRSGRRIGGATRERYTVRAGDRSTQLACRVQGRNAADMAQATSPPVRVRR